MAVTHWQCGRASETTATVVVRADSTGNVPVVANGVTLQAACDTSVNDGNALVEFTGLTPATDYSYTVGGATGGTLRTFPSGGTFWLAFSSCWNIQAADTLAPRLLRAPLVGAMKTLHQEMVDNLRAVFLLGDLLYQNISATVNGYALTLIDGGTLANGKDVALRRQYHRAQRLTPGLRDLMRNRPCYVLKDDHEYDPDNACYDVAWVTSKYGSGNQTDLDELWTASSTAWREWNIGNPESEVTTGVIGGPDCYRVRIGGIELWCTDQIHERTFTTATDGPAKFMQSAAQEEWQLSTMGSSSATFKAWVSTKQFISSCGRNSDGWGNIGGFGLGYETQLGRILSDPRFPRAGGLSITGDEHIPSDMFAAADQFGAGSAAISQISAGPASIAVITDPDDGLTYRSGVRNKERDISTQDRRGNNNYVLLRVMPDRVERYVLGSRSGLQYMGYIGTNSNVVRR